MLQTGGLFELEPPLPEDPGVVIFRRVDYVAQGRALSDQGQHEQAVAILNKAVNLEPTNVEAWANLTFAYSRQGVLEAGIAAGRRGLTLSPSHYYLNLLVGQMLYERGEWSPVIPLAEQALTAAPSNQERATILMLMGKSYHRLNNRIEACRRLSEANAAQPSPQTALEIENLRCPAS